MKALITEVRRTIKWHEYLQLFRAHYFSTMFYIVHVVVNVMNYWALSIWSYSCPFSFLRLRFLSHLFSSSLINYHLWIKYWMIFKVPSTWTISTWTIVINNLSIAHGSSSEVLFYITIFEDQQTIHRDSFQRKQFTRNFACIPISLDRTTISNFLESGLI